MAMLDWRKIIVAQIGRAENEVKERLKDGRYASAGFYFGTMDYLDHVLKLEYESKEQMFDDAMLMGAKMLTENNDYNRGVAYGIEIIRGFIEVAAENVEV